MLRGPAGAAVRWWARISERQRFKVLPSDLTSGTSSARQSAIALSNSTLTGTMRGFERDRMVERAVFKAFAGAERPSESYWLIATSSGEVGINISSDRLITDLDTLDHLLQRFGRLNRFGETTGEAYVLVSNASQKEDRNKAALDFLRSLDSCGNETYDISPAALFGRELPFAACSEVPLLAELHDWLIDVWSQTSLGAHSARPAVDPWLHGNEKDRPETHVAWRDDVRDLVGNEISREEREEALQKYRLLAHEQLRESSTKLLEKLEKLAQAQDGGTSFLLRKADGSVDVKDLSEFAKIETESQRRSVIADIAFCQLILPPGCGSTGDVAALLQLKLSPSVLHRLVENGSGPRRTEPVCQLVEAQDDKIWPYYFRSSSFWHSVTPVVLHGYNSEHGKFSLKKT